MLAQTRIIANRAKPPTTSQITQALDCFLGGGRRSSLDRLLPAEVRVREALGLVRILEVRDDADAVLVRILEVRDEADGAGALSLSLMLFLTILMPISR
jgi:hypothetical protein